MKIKNISWPVKRFLEHRSRIESQPIYQRGAAWLDGKRALLIDSILRSLDVPKIYLRKLKNNSVYDYQIVDGQQRLTAIWRYALDGSYALSLPEDLADAEWADCAYGDLAEKHRIRFGKFKLSVAIIENSTEDEVRELFSRLQMGEHLTSAEMRNSIKSKLGTEIRNIAENHEFFRKCEFSAARFKHHELAALAFALQLHKGEQNVKAPDLKAMYLRYADSVPSNLANRVSKVLDVLKLVQQAAPGLLDRKWGFVDLYLVVSKSTVNLSSVDAIAQRYRQFEDKRRMYVAHPEVLLEGDVKDRPLYDYIQAFKSGGGLSENLMVRNRVLAKRIID